MNKRFYLVVVLAMAFSLTTLSSAVADPVEFCFEWDLNIGSDGIYGDYLIDNSEYVQGERVRFYVQKKISLLNWQTVYDDRTASSGCEILYSLEDGAWYRVVVIANALARGSNQIRAYAPDPMDPAAIGDIHAQMVTPVWGFQLDISQDYDFIYDYVDPSKTSNVMAVATHSFERHYADIADEDLKFLARAEDGGSGGYDKDEQLIRLYVGARDRKFVIAHEIGHFVNYITNANEGINSDSGYYDSNCPSDGPHAYDSLEHQGCAAKEGFANFYATAVFNDPTQADCSYMGYVCSDYTHQMLACHPMWLPWDFAALGVEGDWNEFYWELHSGAQEWTVLEIAELFHHVDTSDWDGGGHANVIESLSDAAHTLYGSTMGNYFDDQSDLGDVPCTHACIGF